MIPFETESLRVRRWEERDRPAFHRLNSDPEVMRFFPFRRDRAESDAMLDRLNARLDRDGMTFFALETKADGALVGMTGLARLGPDLPFAPGVEIGWRLFPEVWGKGYATEAARACLDRAFSTVAPDAVVSFCVADNHASEAVMQRLGFKPDGEFDHPAVDPLTHPHLVRHKLYRLARPGGR
jgi:RimJ/RimL family protein N-acetyltransferase